MNNKELMMSGARILIETPKDVEVALKIIREHGQNPETGNILSGRFMEECSSRYIVFRENKFFYGSATGIETDCIRLNHWLSCKEIIPSKYHLMEFLGD